MMHRICILPGDGIGPQVMASAERILRALPIEWEFTRAEIGFGAFQRMGTPLPQETLDAIRECKTALFGAVTTPTDIADYFSPVVRMRQALDLFANLRPVCSIPHTSSYPGIDMFIVRENSEGLYSGIERMEENGERAVTERIITRRGSQRIVRAAFELARRKQRKSVHVVHKANVLQKTCGLFRATALEVAAEYPEIPMKEMLVDTCAMELVRAPEQFEVIVTTNLFGDILSDEASMLGGGLGLAASANLGQELALFEPVHGSAPALAGSGQANPGAAILAAAMLLEHLDEKKFAERVREAVMACVGAGETTPDLGGALTTEQATESIMRRL